MQELKTNRSSLDSAALKDSVNEYFERNILMNWFSQRFGQKKVTSAQILYLVCCIYAHLGNQKAKD